MNPYLTMVINHILVRCEYSVHAPLRSAAFIPNGITMDDEATDPNMESLDQNPLDMTSQMDTNTNPDQNRLAKAIDVYANENILRLKNVSMCDDITFSPRTNSVTVPENMAGEDDDSGPSPDDQILAEELV